MPSNLKIDDKLLWEAKHLSGLPSKRETVNEALRGYIRHLKQLKILTFEGAFEEFDDYDYKKFRNRIRE